MFENLKEMPQFEYKDSYDITEKIEEELVQVEENSHKYASESFLETLNKVADQKEPLNITSVGENIFYHSIHFLKGRGWTEESLVGAVRSHYNLYNEEPGSEEPEPEPESIVNLINYHYTDSRFISSIELMDNILNSIILKLIGCIYFLIIVNRFLFSEDIVSI